MCKPTVWKAWAKSLKREVYALCLAIKHPDAPWYARAMAVLVVAYAISPIDLIPDFIPVIGYLDDLILVPLGVVLVRRLMPREVMEDCRRRAENIAASSVLRWAGLMLIVLIWLFMASAVAWLVRRRFQHV